MPVYKLACHGYYMHCICCTPLCCILKQGSLPTFVAKFDSIDSSEDYRMIGYLLVSLKSGKQTELARACKHIFYFTISTQLLSFIFLLSSTNLKQKFSYYFFFFQRFHFWLFMNYLFLNSFYQTCEEIQCVICFTEESQYCL